MIPKLIDEIKEWLSIQQVSEDSLRKYLSSKGCDNEMIRQIILEMPRTPGFSLMNDKITYRGEGYVAPTPPNKPI